MHNNYQKSNGFAAFISYRHTNPDEVVTSVLQKIIETYRAPKGFRNGKAFSGKKVFLDISELSAGRELEAVIGEALEQSGHLFVVCSKRTCESDWVKKEVYDFIALGRGNKITALLIDGDKNEIIPAPLYDHWGGIVPDNAIVDIRQTMLQPGPGKKLQDMIEGLFAFFHGQNAWETGQIRRKLKKVKIRILSRVLGYDFEEFRKAEQDRFIKKVIAIGTSVFLLVSVFFTYVAFNWNEQNKADIKANEQRAEAEEQMRIAVDRKDVTLSIINCLTYMLPDRLSYSQKAMDRLGTIFEDNVSLLGDVSKMVPDKKISREIASNYICMAMANQLANDDAGSKKNLELALNAYETMANQNDTVIVQRDLAVVRMNLAIVNGRLGETDQAMEYYKKALGLDADPSPDKNNPLGVNNMLLCFYNMGNILLEAGKIKEAEELCSQALLLGEASTSGENDDTASRNLMLCYGLMGNIAMEKEDNESAERYFHKALDANGKLLAKSPGGSAQNDYAVCCFNLGVLESKKGNVDEAEEYLKTSLEISKKLAAESDTEQTQEDLALDYMNVGILYMQAGDNASAKSYLEEGFSIWSALVNENSSNRRLLEGLAENGSYLGKALTLNNELPKAGKYLKDSLDTYKLLAAGTNSSLKLQKALAGCYADLATWLFLSDDFTGAIEPQEKALDLLGAFHDQYPDDAEMTGNLAEAYHNLSQYELYCHNAEKAVLASEKALSLLPGAAVLKVNLAHAYLFDGQYEKALFLYMENKDIPLVGNKTFRDIVLEDFENMRKKGISHPDMKKIEILLNSNQ